MNFLAHQFLSNNDPKVMVGNFIADFVKGRQAMQAFEPGVVRGILQHRAIDEYTDKHPFVLLSKSRLRPKYRHYSGVIVDMYYDHFLARNWNSFHPERLTDFAERSYEILKQHQHLLPNQASQMLPYMMRGNWLVNYGHVEGLHRALSGMARRTPYLSKMEEASIDLELHYPEFEKEFNSFFPALMDFAYKFLEDQPPPNYPLT